MWVTHLINFYARWFNVEKNNTDWQWMRASSFPSWTLTQLCIAQLKISLIPPMLTLGELKKCLVVQYEWVKYTVDSNNDIHFLKRFLSRSKKPMLSKYDFKHDF